MNTSCPEDRQSYIMSSRTIMSSEELVKLAYNVSPSSKETCSSLEDSSRRLFLFAICRVINNDIHIPTTQVARCSRTYSQPLVLVAAYRPGKIRYNRYP
ncbi:hypothetical protein F511_30870 [Dorcoceras hygrometricum]|uniref:Uncharacterized protein n=1 Tax=Dorcoceras hygrometricum TaxID=472368 RepID=A0A2Z7A547_9LAMI|nr:hypothetical protein F511_30870 [Dorcoceras hygrometricum]